MSDTTDPLTLYTVNDLAAVIDRRPEWVAKEAAAGRIPSRKIGRSRRFTAQDIADYLESVRVAAANPMARSPRQTAARNRRRSS